MPAWPTDDFGDGNSLTVSDLRQQQQATIQAQDEGLDVISESLARTRHLAVQIGTEVEDQNDLIDGIRDKTERVNDRVRREDTHIGKVLEKSSTTALWIIILCLFAAILVIVAVF